MRYRIYILIFLFSCAASFAQLQVNTTSYTPTQLVNNVLLGPGVVASNIVYTGSALSRGFFNGTNSNIGLDSGLILSTGKAIDAIGPNNSINCSGIMSQSGDYDLDTMSLFPTADAAVLEFDFVPSSDTVKFRYVFASEEYYEGECTPFNDIFAFLLSGPGIIGKQNLAIVPGTNYPVSISSVNAGLLGDPIYGPDSTFSYCHLGNSAYYIDNTNPPGTSVQFDGWTVVLTAQAVVTPCTTYHIKLAIADGGNDNTWDSGVFLEAGSFNTRYITVSNTPIFSGPHTGTAATEGCGKIIVNLRRYDSIPYPRTLNYVLGGTATNGTDYTVSAGNVYFPPGKDTVNLIFDTYYDLLNEGTETVSFTLIPDFPLCNGWTPPQILFGIADQQELSVNASIVEFPCPNDSVLFIANATGGGDTNYVFNWHFPVSGFAGDSLWLLLTAPQSFYLVVHDSCQNQWDSVLVSFDGSNCLPVFPNIITPNGDGINDFFVIKNLEYAPPLNLKIYNRWGLLIYEQNNYQNNWDAVEQNDGTYFFVAVFEDGEEERGFVEVLRAEK